MKTEMERRRREVQCLCLPWWTWFEVCYLASLNEKEIRSARVQAGLNNGYQSALLRGLAVVEAGPGCTNSRTYGEER